MTILAQLYRNHALKLKNAGSMQAFWARLGTSDPERWKYGRWHRRAAHARRIMARQALARMRRSQ